MSAPGVALPTFASRFPHLSTFERITLVDVAMDVLEGAYSHLRQKRARYGIDPVGRLRVLRERAESVSDRAFLEEVLGVFTELRDLHTGVRPPDPLRRAVAVLPALVERYVRGDRPVYLVSKLAPWGRVHPELATGVRVTHWNGVPIDDAVARRAAATRGANEAARLARGLESLSVRPLADHLMPDEHWVELTFITPDRRSLTARLPWRVLPRVRSTPTGAPDAAAAATGFAAAPVNLALDPGGEEAQQAKRELFAGGTSRRPAGVRSRLRIITASVRPMGRTPVGHLRIWSFLHGDHQAVVDECARLLRGFEDAGCRGVLVDIRANPGGVIQSAERLLQLFTPARIEPTRFAFTPTDLTAQFCRIDPALRQWLPSIEAAAGSGEVYSQAYPITDPDREANGDGRHTTLPSVLIVDPLCYSSADLFAAGWVDNEIGPIVGTGGTTGAGGANVWTDHDVALRTDPDAEGSPAVLEGGMSLRVAVRRALRVRASAGIPLEDIGVAVPEPNVHATTRRDLLSGNHDLLRFTVDRLPERR